MPVRLWLCGTETVDVIALSGPCLIEPHKRNGPRWWRPSWASDRSNMCRLRSQHVVYRLTGSTISTSRTLPKCLVGVGFPQCWPGADRFGPRYRQASTQGLRQSSRLCVFVRTGGCKMVVSGEIILGQFLECLLMMDSRMVSGRSRDKIRIITTGVPHLCHLRVQQLRIVIVSEEV